MHRVVELAGVADDHPAVAEQLRHRLEAAFGNEMGGVFLDLRAFDQRRDRGMLLEAVEQARGEVRFSAKSETMQPMPTEMLSLLV